MLIVIVVVTVIVIDVYGSCWLLLLSLLSWRIVVVFVDLRWCYYSLAVVCWMITSTRPLGCFFETTTVCCRWLLLGVGCC